MKGRDILLDITNVTVKNLNNRIFNLNAMVCWCWHELSPGVQWEFGQGAFPGRAIGECKLLTWRMVCLVNCQKNKKDITHFHAIGNFSASWVCCTPKKVEKSLITRMTLKGKLGKYYFWHSVALVLDNLQLKNWTKRRKC